MTSSHTAISTLFLCLIAAFSFFYSLTAYSFSTTAYCIVLAFLTLICIMFGYAYKGEAEPVYLLLALAVAVVFIGYLRDHRKDAFVDFLVLFCGLLLVIAHGTDGTRYYKAIKVITFFAVFFAAGVLLQALLPGVHRVLMSLFPSNFASAVLSGSKASLSGSRGFTTNTGHAAGFICSGIISVIALSSYIKRTNVKSLILLSILFVGLAFTGKRGPFVFLALTIMLYYLIPYRGNEKAKRYWKVFFALLFLVIIYLGFRDFLARIPLMNEIIATIEGLSANEDVSSSRLALYGWALQIFKEHPWFGIGWGMYRTTVIGNVSYRNELDTHNIFLQLFAETGIVGFFVFAAVFAYMWVKTKNAYVKCLSSDISFAWQVSLSFSFMYQTFFLLYGLTGNPLYDQHYQILYMISCAIYAGYQFVTKRISRI